jgi:glutamate synthase (NADPH/NADH) small chain
MEHLVPANRVVAGRDATAPIDAAGKNVVIIGGGDTAADCLGVAHRQGAAAVYQLDLYPEPPAIRDEARDPWPTWPWILRNYPAHEEGGERDFAVGVQEFVHDGTGAVRAVRIAEVSVTKVDGHRRIHIVPGTERELPADLVFLAMGFTGAQREGLIDALGVEVDGRGNVARDGQFMSTKPGVFVAGDMGRGQSLIVWAIAEGRAAAAATDLWLTGESALPRPVTPTAVALR